MRVMILEDNVFISMQLEDQVQQLGHEVLKPVKTVEEAMALISQDIVEFSLIDVELGESLATTVAQELSDRGVPFVYVTGNDERLVRATMPEGRILGKPILASDLREVLTTALSEQNGLSSPRSPHSVGE